MKNFSYKLYYLLKYFFLEFKNILRFIKIKFYNLSRFNIINYILYLFKIKKLKYKDENISTFLKKNTDATRISSIEMNSKKEVLVELLLNHHSERTIMNCLISKDIQKFYGSNITALIKKNDYLTKSIAESFGIDKFIYLEEGSFLQRIKSLFRAIDLVNVEEIEKKLINIKVSDLEVGKTAYENYLRFYNFNHLKKNKFLLYVCLAKSLIALEFAQNIFKKKYNMFIIGELQYIPYRLLFHCALKKKIPVYNFRGSASLNFIGRLFKNYKDRNVHQLKFSKKLSTLLNKILEKKIKKDLLDIKKESKNLGKDRNWASKKNYKYLKFKSKKNFCKYFDLDINKKTALLLPHAMSDNLFNNEWNIFLNPYNWFFETLNKIKKIKNVNWIIKPHPSEGEFRGVTAKQIFDDLKINQKNIVLLDHKIYVKDLNNFIDIVLTGNGSPGYQFPALGIPAITTSDARYSNFNISYEPKNKEQYFKLLSNLYRVKKIKKNLIKRAQVFWLSNSLLANSHNLLPTIYHHHKFKEKKFFKLLSKKKTLKYKEKSFSDDLFFQLTYNNRHSINSSFYNKYKKKYNFKLNDI